VLIQIDKLKRRPRQIEVDESASYFPVLLELGEKGAIAFNEPIKGDLEAVWAGEFIEVTGQLATEISIACARCLAPVVVPLDIRFTLSYANSDNTGAVADVEELEIQDDELGLIPFDGPEIDLQPDLEQEIVMALPQQALCQETCKGLCPVCGGNLNMNCCNCEQPALHIGMSALKNFKVEK
jgi:uncharacterized protein